MPCYHPITAYYGTPYEDKTKSKIKRDIVFNPSQAGDDTPLKIACGQCVGCRLEKSRQWAMRCVHESQLHDYNSFITLTYDNNNLPLNPSQMSWEDDIPYNPLLPSLKLEDFQKFMKRLRKHSHDHRVLKSDQPIKFYHCGEYGENTQRPHYHAIIFNWEPADKKLWTIRNENRLYTSELLSELWPYGFASIGDVTFESAAYVARYVMKKITGTAAEAHYCGRKPEYTTMSRREGIGGDWLKKFKGDVYQRGMEPYVSLNGKKLLPPKYYEEKLKKLDFEHYDEIKEEKSKNSLAKETENTYERLKARETVTLAKIKQLKREI